MSTEYRWLNKYSQRFLEDGYLLENQTVEDRIKIIADSAEAVLNIPGYSEKFIAYFKKGWISLSTPVWANFGTNRGLPISCFGSHISDTMESILGTNSEVGMMTKCGGGTSAYFGDLRPRGSEIKNNGKSSGAVHFMQLFDTTMQVISQGSTRRGSFAAYLPIDHGDILEFLKIKSEGDPIQDISFGVCVPDYWMKEMIEGDKTKRKIWAKILETRANVGYPYIIFTDNANNQAPDVYKDKNLRITHSNLCSEIFLPDNDNESFVCDLSSVNLLYYDEWKDTDLVETVIFLLDAVMTEFIEKASKIPFMERTVNFAKNHRALGLGVLGYHSFLQSKMIAFESMEAKFYNVEIFQLLQKQSLEASKKLAELFGEPELLKGYGRRNTTTMAIAPTKSSAFILGQVSEGIEPQRSNYFIKDLAKGKFTYRNPFLKELLKTKGEDTSDVWDSILKKGGSVQHLRCLTDEEKEVFKTFQEITPKEVIIQASQRQKYIDQGQSLNLMIHPKIPTKDVNRLMLDAWELGIKGLYYQFSVNAAQEFSRNILECKSCQ